MPEGMLRSVVTQFLEVVQNAKNEAGAAEAAPESAGAD
jgi:hypothetical protein